MLCYDMSVRRRQFDGRFAVWALIPDPAPGEDTMKKVSSFSKAPKNMTPPLRWVNIHVADTSRDTDDFLKDWMRRKH